MIEIIIKDFLSASLNVPTFMEFPDKPPGIFVVLKKSGNGRENLLDAATLVANSYAPSMLETAQLNEAVKAALDDLTELPEIASSKRAGDYPAFDTRNNLYRYQAVQTITHY